MMQRSELLQWLREADEQRLESLWTRADAIRREHVGDAVHLRGLIEISNHCVRRCAYCGLRAENRRLQRYRLTADEVLACARQAAALGYGTVVLQAGEDPALTCEWVADLVRRIKGLPHNPPPSQGGVGGGSSRPASDPSPRHGESPAATFPLPTGERGCGVGSKGETGLAVTLSLGEQNEETLRAWRDAGADRYLLRFETSNRALFERIHPARPGRRSDRIGLLGVLRDLDYEVGSGVMIGIPGQTYDDLADDIDLFRELDLDMIGVGPWLPHPETPLGGGVDRIGTKGSREAAGESSLGPLTPWPLGPSPLQVPNTESMTYKVLALARLVCPRANIPSTTALATLNRDSGRELGLQRGANVVMPNLTPLEYRRLYEVYPAKACLYEEPDRFHADLVRRIRGLGRHVGTGAGISPNWQARMNEKGEWPGCAVPGRR